MAIPDHARANFETLLKAASLNTSSRSVNLPLSSSILFFYFFFL